MWRLCEHGDTVRSLGARDDGYELFEIASIDELDLDVFLPVVEEAWKHDYRDQVRQDFTESVLRKLMPGESWVAVLARSRDGSPVGFEVAFERQLLVGQRALRAYYASVFTVSVEHRRRGIGRWVLEGINRLVFVEQGADVIVSTFHLGHAGSPAVVSTFDRIEGWGVRHLHETKIWSRRLDKEPLPSLEKTPRFARIALTRGGSNARLEVVDGDTSIEVPSSTELERALQAEFDVAFALRHSLSGQYLNPDNEASGFLLYDSDDGRPCIAGFNIMPMSINDHRLRPVGQLQFLLAPGASEARIQRIVHHLALFLVQRGCFALSLLDMGMVPATVLRELGFEPTDDAIAFAIRGPKATLDLLSHAKPPLFLDFT